MMHLLRKAIESLPWWSVLFLAIFLGLAPLPAPHIVEKLQLLVSGQLIQPIDIFDLFLHGLPWVLVLIKLAFYLFNRR